MLMPCQPHLPKAAFAQFLLHTATGIGHHLPHRRPPAQNGLLSRLHPTLRLVRINRRFEHPHSQLADLTNIHGLFYSLEQVRTVIEPLERIQSVKLFSLERLSSAVKYCPREQNLPSLGQAHDPGAQIN